MPTSSTSRPTRTARARRSPGISPRCSSPGCRRAAWCSTRSPATPSSRRSRSHATSTAGSSTRRRPAGSSTGSSATRCRRCCGARSRPVCRRAACSRPQCGWWSSASASAWRSCRPATGTCWPPFPPIPRSRPRSSASTTPGSPAEGTSTARAACGGTTWWSSTRPGPGRWSPHSTAPPSLSPQSTRSPIAARRRRRSSRRRSSRRGGASSACPRRRSCGAPRACTSGATSPTCGPTR
jgi:hypothetical protein